MLSWTIGDSPLYRSRQCGEFCCPPRLWGRSCWSLGKAVGWLGLSRGLGRLAKQNTSNQLHHMSTLPLLTSGQRLRNWAHAEL